MNTCDRCGHVISIGDFPFCKGNPSDHGPWVGAEEPLEPYFDEHISPNGEWISNRGDRRRLMRENHLEAKPRKHKAPPIFFDMGSKRG